MNFFQLREALTRTNISDRNVQSDKIVKSSAGFKTSAKPVSGSVEKQGYEFKKRKITDPFANAQRQKDRDVKRKARQIGYVNK